MAIPKFKEYEVEATLEITLKVEVLEDDMDKFDLGDLIFDEVQNELDPFGKGDSLEIGNWKPTGS